MLILECIYFRRYGQKKIFFKKLYLSRNVDIFENMGKLSLQLKSFIKNIYEYEKSKFKVNNFIVTIITNRTLPTIYTTIYINTSFKELKFKQKLNPSPQKGRFLEPH